MQQNLSATIVKNNFCTQIYIDTNNKHKHLKIKYLTIFTQKNASQHEEKAKRNILIVEKVFYFCLSVSY